MKAKERQSSVQRGRRDDVSGGEGERLKAMTLSRGHCVEGCWRSSLAVGR